MKKIHINPAHKGDLHKALGIPQDKPIPAKKLEAATNSSNAHVREMADFAKNARGFKHGK
jgi:hypothetical protein